MSPDMAKHPQQLAEGVLVGADSRGWGPTPTGDETARKAACDQMSVDALKFEAQLPASDTFASSEMKASRPHGLANCPVSSLGPPAGTTLHFWWRRYALAATGLA